MDRKYGELVAGRIYFGGAADTNDAVRKENVDVVFDVRVNGRDEAVEYNYIHSPITEDATAETIKAGAEKIAEAYKSGEKIYIHCGGGNGRASVMATAILLEIGATANLGDAVERVKTVRSAANVRPNMQAALDKLYK
ncbi:protein-tyrosine phosphatase family protein [Solibacillus sp. FSL H8-0538]|uniref:protein-tyrosine phosphatase family protein n=1 Tax=Solibacillus sp. FSL H8-0538 TaxID=2921400 RepID=UPI0030FA16D6